MSKESYRLDNRCPECGCSLYTYLDTPAGDHPECERWNIECTVCIYEDDRSFSDLESLSKVFIIHK